MYDRGEPVVPYCLEVSDQPSGEHIDKCDLDMPKRFRIALSFPGEVRVFVADIAQLLSRQFGDESILYDKFHEAEFARPNLDTHLQALYHDHSELVVVFLSVDYDRKEWPGLEWRAIRDLIKARKDESVMLVRLDETPIRGLFSLDGYVDAKDKDAAAVVRLICERLETLGGEIPSGLSSSGTDRPFPQAVRDAINRGVDFVNGGYHAKAREEFEAAAHLADETGHISARVDAREHLALVMLHFERNAVGARELLELCLGLLAQGDDKEERAEVLDRLAHLYDQEGDLEMSENVQRQSLTIFRELADLQAQAVALLNLAWIVGQRGRTDEALVLNNEAYAILSEVLHAAKRHTTTERDFTSGAMGNLFFQRAKIHQRRGEVDESERALKMALAWQRKGTDNHELAKILFALAELKFFRQEMDAGANLLEEAHRLFQERGMHLRVSDCLFLMGRVHASVGHFNEARHFFSDAAAAAAEAGRNQEAADALRSLAHVAEEHRDVERARQLLLDAKAASDDGEFQARCLMDIRSLVERDGNSEERRSLLREAISLVRHELSRTRSEQEGARQYLTLGRYLGEDEQFDEALRCVVKAREWFDKARDEYRSAQAGYDIAGLLERLGRREEARLMAVTIHKMIDGKPFFDVAAALDLSLARFALRDEKLAEAERLIDHGLSLCREHELSLLMDALLLKDELETMKRAGTATAALPDLLDNLHQQLSLCPGNVSGYVRFWAFSHALEISGALKGTLGPNVALFVDDLTDFLQLSAAFKPYRDWSIILPTQEYPENVTEVIPLSREMCLSRGVALLGMRKAVRRPETLSDRDSFLRAVRLDAETRARIGAARFSTGSEVARYFLVALDKDPEQFGGATSGLSGESLSLPPAVHQLLETRSVEELKAERLFFLYYNRGLVSDDEKLLYDLAGLQRYHCIPVYRGVLPHATSVSLVASCPLALPSLDDVTVRRHKTRLQRIRRAFLDVLTTNEVGAAVALANLSVLTEELVEKCNVEASLRMVAHVLGYDSDGNTRTHAALVVLGV